MLPPLKLSSATMRATEFPSIEYILHFIEGKPVMADGLRNINISAKGIARTLIFNPEK
jgi:hypothetical protein